MTLILKRASASRSSGEWNDDDFDVLADRAVVGRIMKAAAAPVGRRGYGHSAGHGQLTNADIPRGCLATL